jgi:hypothetical protein
LSDEAEARTRRWLSDCVLALELCPFAAPVVADNSLRVVVSRELSPEQQLRDFLRELDLLQSSEETDISTTLLVLARGPEEFDEFLGLQEQAQGLLEQAGLEGLVQVVGFHPDYRFEGEAPESPSHFTNRSPYPTFHLIREAMLTRVLASFPDPAAIPERNIERLEELGREAVVRLWRL